MGLRIERRENMRGRAPKLQRGLGGDRFDVRDPAHSVGAKDFLGCGLVISSRIGTTL